MRQVFTSQRLETVEGVARMLEDAGISVHISNGRSYRGRRGSQFSFSEPTPASKQPALWIKHPNDQPLARQLLREAGLLDSTRPEQQNSFVLPGDADAAPRSSNWGWRIRTGLLVLVGVGAFITINQSRKSNPQPPAPMQQPAAAPGTPPAQNEDAEEEVRVRISPSQ